MHQIKDLVVTCVESIEKSYERRGALSGLQTGFKEFDILTNGLQRSSLIVIASLPGTGKTTFALNVVDHVAVNSRVGVVLFSLGIEAKQLMTRLIASRSRVSIDRLRDGCLQEKEFPNLMVASSKLAESPLFIDDTGLVSMAELRSKVKEFTDE